MVRLKVSLQGMNVSQCNGWKQTCVCVCGWSPVDQRVPHAGGDGGGLCCVTQSEDALDDRQLGAGGVQAAERAPVVDHHPRGDHLTAPVHCAGLNRKLASLLCPKCNWYLLFLGMNRLPFCFIYWANKKQKSLFTTFLHFNIFNHLPKCTTSTSIYKKTYRRFIQSLTTRGTCSRDDSSSWSSMDVFGWTRPPWLLNAQ